MNQDDIKNLVGWLRAIYKETQMARGEMSDVRNKINMIPDIRDSTHRGTQDSGDAERKIEETRHHLDDRLNKVEDVLRDLRSMVKELQAKVDRIK